MAKIKIVLWTNSTNKEGLHPIRMRISKLSKDKYIGLNKYASPDQWNNAIGRMHTKATKRQLKDSSIQVHEDCMQINDYLSNQEIKANDIINDFDKAKINWTFNQFENKFLHKSNVGNVSDFYHLTIKKLKDTGRFGNAQKYIDSLASLRLFSKKFDTLVFSEIDLKFVQDYNTFLQKPRIVEQKLKSGKVRRITKGNCTGNTRKIYFSTLRALLNEAIRMHLADRSTYPFGKDLFEVGKLSTTTKKRYLPTDYLMKLKNTPSQKPENELARKLFLFSYFCYGMSYADMADLTTSNIERLENGLYIVYRRKKIKHNENVSDISIKLTDELQTLISDIQKIQAPCEKYLLPIVSIAGYRGEQLFKHIENRYHKFRKYLTDLSIELEIDDINLTSYVSRHTMAMTLQNKAVPREIISQILGHQDLNTTATYLDSFNSNVIDETAKLL